MSSTLYWKKIEEPETYLSDEIKFAIRKYTGESYIKRMSVGKGTGLYMFIKGLSYANVNGADEFIKIIDEYEHIEITEQS